MGWRCALAVLMLIAAAPAMAQNVDDMVRRARADNADVGLLADGPASTDTQIAADLADTLADGDRLRIRPVLGHGGMQDIADLIFRKTIDLALIHTDALARALAEHAIPRIESVEYIARLFPEEVHVLARQEFHTLGDLSGQAVEIGPADGGTALTAERLLKALHIVPDPRHDDTTLALARLRLGQVAAVVIVGGEPVPALLTLPPASGLHFLPLPLTAGLADTYVPSTLEPLQYPNLIPPNDSVETVAVGSLLVTLSAGEGTLRSKRIDRFVDRLYERFDAFRRPGLHPKWREVNLSAQMPGLRRYGEVERRLREEVRAQGAAHVRRP